MIFGTQYYRPPFPNSSDWKADIEKIRKTGFNTVKVWAVWSWIERRQGELYFDDLDEIIGICSCEGLGVVINIIPEGAPYWILNEHSDAMYIANDGQKIGFGGASNIPSGGWPGLCMDDGEVRLLCENFIMKVAERYADSPAVIALDVWNEPHIEPSFTYPDKLFCYCKNSIEKFRNWLKTKYEDIEQLNKTWFRAYSDWNDVLPPPRFATYPDMIDWRNFWICNISAWLEIRVNAARKGAPGKSVITHVPSSGYINNCKISETGLGVYLGDEFKLAQKVDKFGLSTFPKWLMNNDYLMHLLNVEFISSASGGKEFWQTELQAGAGLTGILGAEALTEQDIYMWNWSAVASGASGIMYWQWRPEPSGMESPGFGLAGLCGESSERTDIAGKCIRKFEILNEYDKKEMIAPINGIYVSRTADLFAFSANSSEHLYAKSIYGIYKACVRQGIPVRIIHQDNLKSAMESNLKTLYLPFTLALSSEEREQLEMFQQNGGTLVSEACLGLYDEHGLLDATSSFLERAFGIKDQRIDHVEKEKIIWEKEYVNHCDCFIGKEYRSDIKLTLPDTKILARFEDGKPAVCEFHNKKGTGVLIGSFPSLYIYENNEKSCDEAVTRWMLKEGYNEFRSINTDPDILIRLFKSGEKYIIVMVNYSNNPGRVRIALNMEIIHVCDMPGDGILEYEVNGMDGKIILL